MKQLDPKARWLFFIRYTIGWTLLFLLFAPFIGIFAAPIIAILGEDVVRRILENSSQPYVWVLLLWLAYFVISISLIAIISFIWSKYAYRYYRYELTDEGFRKEHGVIRKRYVTIPYDRIQNVDIHRGILARMLGLSDLIIETAGSSGGAEGRLPGLALNVAEQLRDDLIQRAKRLRSSNR